jgi:hypothetical protein
VPDNTKIKIEGPEKEAGDKADKSDKDDKAGDAKKPDDKDKE